MIGSAMKTAIVHDWLTGMRGGERCLEAFCELFPDADLFTLVHVPGSVVPRIEQRRIHTSLLQRLPGATRHYRRLLPLLPLAVELLDLREYDLVLSSSHCVAKAALARPDALHVSYVHTPMRYAWESWPDYFRPRPALRAALVAPLLTWLRQWDAVTAARVDRFVANSAFVAQRIRRCYGRDSVVVHPPVDCAFFEVERRAEPYYLMVSALVPYKQVELALRAFGELGRPLTIVGDGPERRRLTRLAPPNVRWCGRVGDEELRELYARCRAFVLPGVEDFGIAPLEANAAGRPVIALARGGALETVVERGDRPTGLLYGAASADGLKGAVLEFERREASFDPAALRAHARRFDRPRFLERMRAVIDESLEAWDNAPRRRRAVGAVGWE